MKIDGIFNEIDIKTDIIDETTKQQLEIVSNQQIFKDSNIKIMPDCHAGAGCVIGFTMNITDFVIPNLVGVDIGCGVSSYCLENYKDFSFAEFDSYLKQNIPSGFNIRNIELPIIETIKNELDSVIDVIDSKSKDRFYKSLGTLGGGNHFIELGKDSNNRLYLTVHTGSRNFGLQVANFYQNIANKKCIDMPKGLSYLQGKDMQNYLRDMKVAQKYAKLNRLSITNKLLEFFEYNKATYIESVHNYIGEDNILRKGAISAYKNESVLIPFNMRDGLILGKGLGNIEWNYSAPHGAGRILSRTQAKEKINIIDFEESMNGIWTSCVNQNTLDESPMAYKPKEEILKYVNETVEIIDFIKPIYNFKAGE